MLRGKNPLSDIILPNIFDPQNIATGSARAASSDSPVDRTMTPGSSNVVTSNGGNILSTAFNGVSDFFSETLSLGNATTIPQLTSSPATPIRLSDFNRTQVGPALSGRNIRLQQINDRITRLQTQLASDSENTNIQSEIAALEDRRRLEFNQFR